MFLIELRLLNKYSIQDEKSLGLHGYKSSQMYKVEKEDKGGNIVISINMVDLKDSFIKEWPFIEEDFKMYNEVIKHGLSFGAYDYNKLVGIIIVEEVKWNNSFNIANLMVSEEYRGKGIGSQLIDKVTYKALERKIRIISLETQSTNMPSIKFYKKNGFKLEALDLSLYTNNDLERKEVAFIMKKKLSY